MQPDEIKKILKDYLKKHPLCVEFGTALSRILADVLASKNLHSLSIDNRVKSKASLKLKLESGVIKDASTLDDVYDLVGVRIITYVYEDTLNIEKVLQKSFSMDPINVDQRLGVDRVGYRSHHWLISLSPIRIKLPEYKKFEGLKAELQIRTILQHAWAQIGHNQIYKPNVKLPEKIKRDFALLAGLLEIADNEFSRISNEILKYNKEVGQRADSGDLDLSIDSVSLRVYFDKRFGSIAGNDQIFGPGDDMVEMIIEELQLIGITRLNDLDALVPKGFKNAIKN